MSLFQSLGWYKFLRFIHSTSSLFTITAILSLIGLYSNQQDSSSPLNLNVMPHWFWVVLLTLSIVFLIMKAMFEYNRQTYDPKRVIEYQDYFLAVDFLETRKEASKIIKDKQESFSALVKNNKESAALDEVLDFFEEIGFYVKGRQISPEVAHHHFYHWIRGYYSFSKPYICLWRDKEKSRWENIEALFLITYEIEKEANGRSIQEELDIPKKEDFLGEEIGLET